MTELREKAIKIIEQMPEDSMVYVINILNSMTETAYLCSMPDVKQSIIDGMNTPVKECATDVGL